MPPLNLLEGRGTIHLTPDLDYIERAYDHAKYGHGRGRAAYVTDPGGHVVEFWTWDVANHLRELAAGESPGTR